MKVILQKHLTIYCRWLRWINDHELVVAYSLLGTGLRSGGVLIQAPVRTWKVIW